MFNLPIVKKNTVLFKNMEFLKIKKQLKKQFSSEYNMKSGFWDIDLKPNQTRILEITTYLKLKNDKILNDKYDSLKPLLLNNFDNVTVNHMTERNGDIVIFKTTVTNNTNRHLKGVSLKLKLNRNWVYVNDNGLGNYTKMTEFNDKKQYFVVNRYGQRIIPYEFAIDKNTVLDAWKTTLRYVTAIKQVKSNSIAFSEHKSTDSIMSKIYNQK